MKPGYFFALLTLIFVTLKLTGHISWSWWLVLLPFYGSALLALILVLSGIVLVALARKGKSK